MSEQKTPGLTESQKAPQGSPSILKRLVMFFTPDSFMFFTHTPGDWCKPGTVHDKAGEQWIVTRWKQEAPAALYGGGRATCFEVRGKKRS